ncbi:LysR substrate-binding domain-containing protein [Crenobacter cavernae]|uniref:LysR family transcriptional regulator n=1 Tax=Crenobacter cavernae TaxID=2290923 RepID=A0ABY0FGE5_9NEIS|nr:LysR substrate-binding domain-containing protein [Crenobacter cavernae]RXZ45458.1 LysR family transcriptional regulator [Crenobacter cavernae]
MSRRTLPLYALSVFEAAARHLSFTRAADELCLTQGAVSKQVAQLEAQLGYPLFLRQVRSLALTVQGETLLPHVQKALATLDKGVELARGASRRLRLKAPSCAARWLLREMRQFSREEPGIAVEVSSVHAHQVDFAREAFDLAVVFCAIPAADSALTPLFLERLTPVLSPSLRDSERLPLASPEDLAAWPLLHPSSDRRDWRRWFAEVGGGDVGADGGAVFDSLDQAMNAALQGFGVTLGDVTLLSEELAAGQVVAPFDVELVTGSGYALARPRASEEGTSDGSPAGRLFDWLVARHGVPAGVVAGLVPRLVA